MDKIKNIIVKHPRTVCFLLASIALFITAVLNPDYMEVIAKGFALLMSVEL